jgi:hypothetical protein
MQRAFSVFAILVVSLVAVNVAFAGRVVDFEVLVDGKVVLYMHKLDQGEDADTAWGYLKTNALVSPAEAYVVSDEEAARLKAFHEELNKTTQLKTTLQGKCRVFCRYAGDVTVDELRLVRANPKAPWFLDPAQVDELAKKRHIDSAMRVRSRVDEAAKP